MTKMFSPSIHIFNTLKKDSLTSYTVKRLLQYESSYKIAVKQMRFGHAPFSSNSQTQAKKHLLQLWERSVALHTSKILTSDTSALSNTPEDKGKSDSTTTTESNKKPDGNSSFFAAAIAAVIPRKKEKMKDEEPSDLSRERNFLTALRAMSEFLLTPADLEELRKTKRRSPFENEPPITVFWRRDVEAKALKVWGSREVLEKEKQKREKERQSYQEHLFNLKKVLRSYEKEKRRKQYSLLSKEREQKKAESLDASGKVVWAAVLINGANFGMKLGAWAYTGSHSLFAEALHSFADFTNQLILAYGIHKSNQQADVDHPYGYTTMRYVSSLISGAMIFCVGAGVSIQHGISGLLHPSEVVPLFWAFFILGGSLISEGGTLVMAVNAIKKGAKRENVSFVKYVLRGNDPSVNVVLLEDMAAVLGVGIALSCMGLTSITGSHIPDALGSCIIGALLAGVSGFIVYTNSAALVGRSIPHHDIQKINDELESDVMIRAIHDVKGIDMGSGYVRYKAEVDFDGRALTRKYLSKQDVASLLKEMNCFDSPEQVEAFILKHGENIVEGLGAEVDRIEKSLKNKHPQVRHIDLEIL